METTADFVGCTSCGKIRSIGFTASAAGLRDSITSTKGSVFAATPPSPAGTCPSSLGGYGTQGGLASGWGAWPHLAITRVMRARREVLVVRAFISAVLRCNVESYGRY